MALQKIKDLLSNPVIVAAISVVLAVITCAVVWYSNRQEAKAA